MDIVDDYFPASDCYLATVWRQGYAVADRRAGSARTCVAPLAIDTGVAPKLQLLRVGAVIVGFEHDGVAVCVQLEIDHGQNGRGGRRRGSDQTDRACDRTQYADDKSEPAIAGPERRLPVPVFGDAGVMRLRRGSRPWNKSVMRTFGARELVIGEA